MPEEQEQPSPERPGMTAADYEEFKRRILELTGLDLSSYKQRQMQRRINSLMESLKVPTYRQYFQLLQADPVRYEEFLKRITINVSEFFRNPERFADLEQKYLPQLLAKRRPLKVWSAGCSTGPEPYSLAILLLDLAPGLPHRVLATDIDKAVLEKAKAGVYQASELKNVSPARLARYFDQVGEAYRVKDEVKAIVDIRRHNLLTDPFDRNFDLILCRNVVIYFTEDAKHLLYQKFYQALAPGGFFLVGGTEPILRYREYGYEAIGPTFYRRPETTAAGGR
ncbi:MAG: protein-glutamate O-methyltransferase CheR [Bacillota bacterium]|nr:protein-glutamate O-methyltransferase CheR [Bacillota bacterium]